MRIRVTENHPTFLINMLKITVGRVLPIPTIFLFYIFLSINILYNWCQGGSVNNIN
jgi:hypothetical protein